MPARRRRRVLLDLLLASASGALLFWALSADEAWLDRHFLPDFRIPRSHTVIGLHTLRTLAVLAAVLLVVQVRPWLQRRADRHGLIRLLALAAPSLFAAALAIPAAELILRMTEKPRLEHKVAAHEPRRVPDAQLGFRFAAGRVSYGDAGGRSIRYVFDPSGYRVAEAGERVDPARPTILLVGESIMCGYGLKWDETIAAQVEQETGVQVADLAVEGYSIDQAFMRFRQEWGRFRQPVAVVTLFLPSAMYRTLEETRPRFAPGLTWQPPEERWWLERVIRRRASYRKTGEVEAAVLVARQVLTATAREARARGAEPLVVVPVLTPEPVVERRLRQRVLGDADVPYVLVPIPRAWRLPDDRHPDPRGAREIAAAIVGRLEAAPNRS
ncbi:hypothetical protein [Phenylobacterium sp.]|jgi:hypothetical protein|uniref:hypothetical protein n=1 Tax=Phenylobacterium sp. TaxID=1871053 RepID=UPI003784E092